MAFSGFRKLALVAFISPMFLVGCDGYELVLTDDYFPYGNQRTAGSGVAYVLAKMLPEKSLKLEAVTIPEASLEPVEKVKRIVKEIKQPTPPVVKTPMEDVFQDAQTK